MICEKMVNSIPDASLIPIYKKFCDQCTLNADCVGNTDGQICDTAINKCVECNESIDCASSSAGSICDKTINKCIKCTLHSQCFPLGLYSCNFSTGKCFN